MDSSQKIAKSGSITKQRRKPKFYFSLHPRNYSWFYINRIQKKINLFIRFIQIKFKLSLVLISI